MYFADLTPYRYFPGNETANLFNVGWLAKGYEFPVGACHEAFIRRLFELCQHPVELCRGHHNCDLCPPVEMRIFDFGRGPVRCRADTRQYHLKDGRTIWTDQIVLQQDNVDLWLGNGEVEAWGTEGRGYRAPTLIYHYITEHSYLPPQEFIDAVLQA